MSLAASAHAIWEAALGRLQVQVPRPTYETWLKDTQGESRDDNQLVVRVPSAFVAEWLQTRMFSLITDAVHAVSGQITQVELIVRDGVPAIDPIQNNDLLESAAKYSDISARTQNPSESTFNPRYTFDTFVIGPSNNLAFYSAFAVSDSPGNTYNPLYIHGSVGLGKTHLLHALGAKAKAEGLRVRYVTSEQFTNEFTKAIRDREMDAFHDRYRSVQLLLIDDVQFLAGKDGTQSAFFHTFNELHSKNCQIVVAADRPCANLVPFNDRLKSRLEWGLSVEITEPDYETKVAILEKHALRASTPIPASVLEYIASAGSTGVRQLEGSLNKVMALSQFSGEPVSQAIAARILRTQYEDRARTPEDTISKVANFYGISPRELKGVARNKTVSHARQVAMLLLRQGGMRAEEIGLHFGKRDRTTVSYAIQRVLDKSSQDPSLQKSIESLNNGEN